ncbi:CD48 antigen [Saccopteryx bilineata]|uniref:CD48 antigen n=1 Tax=Saccopteryx bilineata TaxID=59482 RepID=UPI00338FCD2E
MCFKGLKWYLALKHLLLLHFFLETSIQARSEHQVLEVSGSNVSLGISNLPDNHQSLTWFYTSNQKIVEWESNTPKPHYYKNKFKDRVMLDLQNGTLYIYKVQKEDSSTYLLKVLKEDGTEEQRWITLKVFDPVPKPDIKIKTQEVNNSCILSCESLDQSVNYTWITDSRTFPEELQKSILEFTIEPQNHYSSYTCQVSNPVSHNSHTVNVTSDCKLVQSSGVAWISVWLVVMVTTILGLLLTQDKLS